MSASGFNLYNAIIKPLRDDDVTQLLKRFVGGAQIIRDDAEAEILSLKDQVNPGKVRADILQYLMPQVGFTSELRSVTDRLTEAQLRRLIRVAVPLWNQRHTRAGLVNGIRLLTGRSATVNDWFDYRAILDEVSLSEDVSQPELPVEQFIAPRITNDGFSVVNSLSGLGAIFGPNKIAIFRQPNVAANDVMLAFTWTFLDTDSKLDTTNVLAGWELLSEIKTGGTIQVCLLRHKMTLGETGLGYAFNVITRPGAVVPLFASVVAYRDIDPDVALVGVDFNFIPGATTTMTCPSLVLSNYSDLYLGFVASTTVFQATTTSPIDSVKRINDTASSLGWATIFELKRWVAGATGTEVVNYSSSTTGIAVAYALAIKPVKASGALWVIGGLSSYYDEYWTNIRLMDDGTLDELLLLDVCKLMRPLDEHFEIVLLDFLDHFDGVLDKWAPQFCGSMSSEARIDNDGPHPKTMNLFGDVKPLIPIWGDSTLPGNVAHDYNVSFRFLLETGANSLTITWYSNGAGYSLFLATGRGTLFAPGPTVLVTAVNWPEAARFGINSWNTIHIQTVNIDSTTRSLRITVNGNQAVPIDLISSELIDTGVIVDNGGVIFSSTLAGTYIDDVEIWRNPIRFATIGISTPAERGGSVIMSPNFVQ